MEIVYLDGTSLTFDQVYAVAYECGLALPVTGANSWFRGPLGGTSVGAVQIGTTGIFCVPLTIAAASGPGIAEIPTIGQWGLMVLGLLLVITGVVAFWHKRAFANH